MIKDKVTNYAGIDLCKDIGYAYKVIPLIPQNTFPLIYYYTYILILLIISNTGDDGDKGDNGDKGETT